MYETWNDIHIVLRRAACFTSQARSIHVFTLKMKCVLNVFSIKEELWKINCFTWNGVLKRFFLIDVVCGCMVHKIIYKENMCLYSQLIRSCEIPTVLQKIVFSKSIYKHHKRQSLYDLGMAWNGSYKNGFSWKRKAAIYM